MKKITLSFTFFILQSLIFSLQSFGQGAPQATTYQAVARYNGNLIVNKAIAVRFSILDGSASGTVVYEETQSVTTNAFGLFTVNLGQGTQVSDLPFTSMDWGGGAKWVKMEADLNGGTNYVPIGTPAQLLSVPYALYAGASAGWSTRSDVIYNNNAGNVGIGTFTPQKHLHVYGAGEQEIAIQSIDAGAHTWTLQGNGTSSYPVTFQIIDRSVNQSRLGIDNNGNVGIGTPTPTNKLSVAGDANFTGRVGIGTSVPFYPLHIYGPGVQKMAIESYDFGATQWVLQSNGTSSLSSATFQIIDALSSRSCLGIDNSGKVGIGTSLPAKHLHVYGSGDQEIAIQSSDAGAHQWTLQSNGTSSIPSTFQIIDRTVGQSRVGIDNSGNVTILGRVDIGSNVIGSSNPKFYVKSSQFLPAAQFDGDVNTNGILEVNGRQGYACTFDGKVVITGSAGLTMSNGGGIEMFGGTISNACGQWYSCSDIRYKKSILPLTNSLDKICHVNGVNYYWKKDEFPAKHFNDTKQIGVIAQELEKIFPELVFTDDKGYKSVEYAKFVPILIEAVKELNTKSESQQQEIQNLKAENGTLKNSFDGLTARIKAIEAKEISAARPVVAENK